jgi:hypothetical protein
VLKFRARLAPLALCWLTFACHTRPPAASRAVDASMAACIPPDSVLIAGIDLAALRSSPLYSSIPAAAAFAAQFAGVTSAVAAYNGKDLLVIARSPSHTTPAGAVVLAPGLALYGSPEQTAAAKTQYESGAAGAPGLLAQAESVASGAQVWIAARGNAPLPLTGNAANLAAILRKAEFVTLSARDSAALALQLRAAARDVNSAAAIEETLRADLTLAAAGESRHADLAAALRSADVSRQDREVTLSISLSNQIAGQVISALTGGTAK